MSAIKFRRVRKTANKARVVLTHASRQIPSWLILDVSQEMKLCRLLFAFLSVTPAFGEAVGKPGISADLPTSEGWVFAGKTEIPEARSEMWTTRNNSRRESIQFSVVELEGSSPKLVVSSWEQGLLADGRREKVLAKDIEVAGRKACYILA
jgi:hypothetical protein